MSIAILKYSSAGNEIRLKTSTLPCYPYILQYSCQQRQETEYLLVFECILPFLIHSAHNLQGWLEFFKHHQGSLQNNTNVGSLREIGILGSTM